MKRSANSVVDSLAEVCLDKGRVRLSYLQVKFIHMKRSVNEAVDSLATSGVDKAELFVNSSIPP